MASYDPTQSVFAIGLAAGRAENVWGSHAEILDFMEKALSGGGTWRGNYGTKENKRFGNWRVTGFFDSVMAGAGWEIKWGPAIYVHLSEQCAANAMFVAYSGSQRTYVVAVAPTNFISDFAVGQEDFHLAKDKMADFPINPATDIVSQLTQADPRKAQLGTGTAIGLHVLLTQIRDRQGRDLITFLNATAHEAATKLVFAGHSLGGALAPPLALQLWDRLDSRWNRDNVMVLPTAGATPGNYKFAEAWYAKFRRKRSQVTQGNNRMVDYNTLYWNRNDFVPHAWNNFKGWYRFDPLKPHELVTNIGTYYGDDAWVKNAEYDVAQRLGRDECGMIQLSDSTSFTGSWPVKFVDAAGVCREYPQHDSFNSDQDMLVAKQMAHMGQYYQYAGINPCDIGPVAEFISSE